MALITSDYGIAPLASNGPNHLGLLQVKRVLDMLIGLRGCFIGNAVDLCEFS